MWLVPFKGKNSSGTYNQNFLWNDGRVYIMDNHRAALWCWFQKIKKEDKISLFHIDRHRDSLGSRIESWTKACPDLFAIGVEEYLNFSIKFEEFPHNEIHLFRFDNYVSIFLEKYGGLVDKCVFATHKEGDKPKFKNFFEYELWDIPGNLEFWMEDSDQKWICNVDLDYFFYSSGYDEFSHLVSDSYLKQLFSAIKNRMDSGNIVCLTIALSPEWCGGWDATEELLNKIIEILGINFDFPNSNTIKK